MGIYSSKKFEASLIEKNPPQSFAILMAQILELNQGQKNTSLT